MNSSGTPLPPVLRNPALTLDLQSWRLNGGLATLAEKRLNDLKGVFADEAARQRLDPGTVVYTVQTYKPVAEGTIGGLFFGNTTVHPGKVRDEYFMTRGHRHVKSAAAEYYWGVKGEGALLLMDEHRNTWAEKVFPGSLHYIAGAVAHRLVNAGSSPLTTGACWYADAGHNYEEIDRNGFSARLLDIHGVPTLVESR